MPPCVEIQIDHAPGVQIPLGRLPSGPRCHAISQIELYRSVDKIALKHRLQRREPRSLPLDSPNHEEIPHHRTVGLARLGFSFTARCSAIEDYISSTASPICIHSLIIYASTSARRPPPAKALLAKPLTFQAFACRQRSSMNIRLRFFFDLMVFFDYNRF